MGAIITLTTDFGLKDAYVAALKGVILGINPEAQLVDICHTIPPQDISRAAFVLSTACDFFPRSTVHLVVVDPGVGTDRASIILKTPEASFVAPDNGVLSYIFRRHTAGHENAGRWKLTKSPHIEAISITNSRFWRTPASPTFHGRDIFAPVAAHLSLGVPPEEFGPRLTDLNVLPAALPQRMQDGAIQGAIIHIDTFGNLITNVTPADLPDDVSTIRIEVGSDTIYGLSRTYGEGEGLIALIGSSGYIEVALTNGSAAACLKAARGETVRIRRT